MAELAFYRSMGKTSNRGKGRLEPLQRRLFADHVEQLVHRLRHGAARQGDADGLENLAGRHASLLGEGTQRFLEAIGGPIGAAQHVHAWSPDGLEKTLR